MILGWVARPGRNPRLEDAVAAETIARETLEKDADSQTLQLSQQVSEWCLG